MADTNWTLRGNDQTTSDDFLGTTDNKPLVIRTNGEQAMLIEESGNVRVGRMASLIPPVPPSYEEWPGAKLHVIAEGDHNAPQIVITQTTPDDFARLRFQSTSLHNLHSDGIFPSTPSYHYPSWDLAAGNGVLHFFVEEKGNVMTLTNGGDVQIHGTASVEHLHVTGNDQGKGNLLVNGAATVDVLHITGGSDLAEPFSVEDPATVEPGTVMVIDEHHPGKLKISDTAYDRKVAGIASGAGGIKPGLTLQQDHMAADGIFVALTGRVYCKAEAISSPIDPGDLLTTSALAGHAMKAVDQQAANGAILGKAMSSLQEGQGLVLVLVSLQ